MKQNIDKILELLNNKQNWCTDGCARNMDGDLVTATSVDAVSWCLMGAIIKVFGDDLENIYNSIKSKIPMTVGEFNDFMGYEAVIKLLKDIREEL